MVMDELSAGRGSLTAARTGRGTGIAIFHSLLAERPGFDPVLPALARNRRVTLFNLPGFHGSQPPVLALMDAYVATFQDGFQEFGLGSDTVLIGNGFGGTAAPAAR